MKKYRSRRALKRDPEAGRSDRTGGPGMPAQTHTSGINGSLLRPGSCRVNENEPFMTIYELRQLLDRVRDGALDPEEASTRLLDMLRAAPFEDLGFARIDHTRELRQGFPEVILGVGKTPAQMAAIAERIVSRGHSLLITRAEPTAFEAVRVTVPDAVYHPEARAITRPQGEMLRGQGTILIACAGTSDLPVAEEAAVTAGLMGNDVDRLYDVGVAGLHRLLSAHERLRAARVLIVVAGMEGALPSVVAGLVSAPVIAVPTSIGYGASFGGIAALLGMLNSCANGVSVVNIDNGFGAACVASQINHL
jgi:pyridinium-3,5-biscarboxylic acid mononucleotide synthase